MRIKKIQIFLSADQTSILDVNQVFPVFEWNLIFVLLSKILDRLKSFFICITNSLSHCLSRDAEHTPLTAFCWRCDEVEMRGTCLEAQKSMQTKVVINF